MEERRVVQHVERRQRLDHLSRESKLPIGQIDDGLKAPDQVEQPGVAGGDGRGDRAIAPDGRFDAIVTAPSKRVEHDERHPHLDLQRRERRIAFEKLVQQPNVAVEFGLIGEGILVDGIRESGPRQVNTA